MVAFANKVLVRMDNNCVYCSFYCSVQGPLLRAGLMLAKKHNLMNYSLIYGMLYLWERIVGGSCR